MALHLTTCSSHRYVTYLQKVTLCVETDPLCSDVLMQAGRRPAFGSAGRVIVFLVH